MPAHRTRRKTHFTVQEANACLPLVRAIVADLTRLSRDVAERRQRLSFLRSGRPSGPQDYYSEELGQIEKDLEADVRQLQDYVKELNDLGVEPKSAMEGLVDFPTTIDGRRAYLCWKLGEPEVLFWHDLESGFAGRQPLTAEASAGDSPLGGEANG